MASSTQKLDRIESRLKKIDKKQTANSRENEWYINKQGLIESPYEQSSNYPLQRMSNSQSLLHTESGQSEHVSTKSKRRLKGRNNQDRYLLLGDSLFDSNPTGASIDHLESSMHIPPDQSLSNMKVTLNFNQRGKIAPYSLTPKTIQMIQDSLEYHKNQLIGLYKTKYKSQTKRIKRNHFHNNQKTFAPNGYHRHQQSESSLPSIPRRYIDQTLELYGHSESISLIERGIKGMHSKVMRDHREGIERGRNSDLRVGHFASHISLGYPMVYGSQGQSYIDGGTGTVSERETYKVNQR